VSFQLNITHFHPTSSPHSRLRSPKHIVPMQITAFPTTEHFSTLSPYLRFLQCRWHLGTQPGHRVWHHPITNCCHTGRGEEENTLGAICSPCYLQPFLTEAQHISSPQTVRSCPRVIAESSGIIFPRFKQNRKRGGGLPPRASTGKRQTSTFPPKPRVVFPHQPT